MLNRSSHILRIWFLSWDLVVTAAAWAGAYSLRFQSGWIPLWKEIPDFAICARQLPLVVALAAVAYRFTGHVNLHVHGYREKGNINTPLELAILNETSRFHLVIDVIDRVPSLRTRAAHLKEEMANAIVDHLNYAHEFGTDRPEVTNWVWPY